VVRPARVEPGLDERLHLVLRDGEPAAQPLLDEGKGLVLRQQGVARGAVVQLLLLRSPARFEGLHEVGRAHDLDPGRRPHHLDRARVHPAHVRDGRARAVLHGDALHARQVRLEDGLQLLPRPVQDLRSGHAAQGVRLDHVQDADGLALARDEEEPAARADLALVEADDAARDRVAAPKS
jgi:hypothetical protein